MARRRLTQLGLDLARGIMSLAVVLAGVTFLAGQAKSISPATIPAPLTQPTDEAFPLPAVSDTLALLLREEPFSPDPIAALMQSLGPASLLAGRFRDAAESLSVMFQRLAATPSVMPTQGWLISNFSRHRLHPLLGYARPHLGIDVRAPRGTAIEAPAAGTVISAKWEGGYGWAVEIDHGYGIITRYAHTSKMLVKVGDHVQRGDVIARVGQTGLAEGPHLHYEVRVNGKPVDPLKFVLPSVIAD